MSQNRFIGFDEAVVVDVETTGLDPKTDRIVTVALIRADFSSLKNGPDSLDADTVDVMVDPQRRIPKAATRVHGITHHDVAGKGTFRNEAGRLRDFIGDRPVIGHNVSFDRSFLSAEFDRAGFATLAQNRSLCTMLRFQDYRRGIRKGSRLDDAIAAFGLGNRRGGKHNASEDAQLAFRLAGHFYLMDYGI